MRRMIAIALSLLLAPQYAAAQCAGTDLMAQLLSTDAAAHTEVFRRAHAVPNGRGKFWRVSREGVPPSYLYGTFHDTGIARRPLHAAVTEALTGARLLLVELTEAEKARLEARIASDPGFVIDGSVAGLIAELTDAERAVAERKLAENGLTLAVADRLSPWMLFSQVGVPQCMLREMRSGQPVLDFLLTSKAAEAGIAVAGLETYEQALAGFNGIPPDMLREILVDALRNMADEEDLRRTSVALYDAGEIAAIWEFSIHRGADRFGAARSREMANLFAASLIGARNRAWMDVMVPQMRQGGVFAAFGALHLPGDAGVVELLRAEGFEVTRLDG